MANDTVLSTAMFRDGNLTLTKGGDAVRRCPDELMKRYQVIIDDQRMNWTEHHKLLRLLGAGGQGLSLFEPASRNRWVYDSCGDQDLFTGALRGRSRYDTAMSQIAAVAARVAQIQQDNLIDVHNWVDRNRIRLMQMEWIDGYDLNHFA